MVVGGDVNRLAVSRVRGLRQLQKTAATLHFSINYNREISCGISLCVERENDFRCRPMSCCNIGLCSGCSCSSPVVGKRTDAMVADDDIYWVCDTLAVVQVLPGERFSGSIDQRVHCCVTISLTV